MFHRRLIVFISILVVMMSALFFRLAWLQWVRSEHYLDKTQAAFERPARWLETVRGNIYDTKGRALATVEASYQLCLHYNLTRLYDVRFWKTQQLLTGRKKKNRDKTQAELEALVQETFQEDLLLAEQILDDLVAICQVPRQEFSDAIETINNRLFDRQMVRARKVYYRRHGLKYVSQTTMQGIRDDFAQKVPDENVRLTLIGKAAIWEMTQPQPVLPNVSREVALSVEEAFGQTRLGEIILVIVKPKKSRKYPYKDSACHLIGHLGPVGVSELSDSIPPQEDDFEAYFAFDRRGANGIEYMFESLLRGRRGWEHKKRSGENIEPAISPVMGADVTLTLDIELQKDIQELFEIKGYSGAAVVVDVPTGGVRAMVSVPTYDLNTYYHSEFYNVINDPDDPLERKLNRALSVNYQPGSTIKPVVLLGALEMNAVQEFEQINCDDNLKDWPGSPSDLHNHGLYSATDAIRQSCNFYFIKIGEKMGTKQFVNWIQRAGRYRRVLAWPEEFRDRAGRAFNEAVGHVKPLGRSSLGIADLRFNAIGRGALDGSILQIANSTAAIARYGLYLAPTLVQSPEVSQGRIPIASQHYAQVVEGAMAEVVTDYRGSGYNAFQPPLWEPDDVRIYGKTGSTKYSLFTCYARSQKGQECLSLAVIVEADRFGSEAAAPLARMILKKLAQHEYLPEALNYLNEDELVTY